MKLVLNILCILVGLMMINSGLNKYLMYMPMPKDMPAEMLSIMEAFGKIKWLMPLVALAEIVGGLLFMIPKTRALGSLVLFPVMVGILAHHLAYDASTIIIPLIILAIMIWAMYDNRRKLLPLVSA